MSREFSPSNDKRVDMTDTNPQVRGHLSDYPVRLPLSQNSVDAYVEPSETPVTALPYYYDQPAVIPIVHSPAVAVGRFGDGIGAIWAGLIMSLSGLYPLGILLSSLDNPQYLATMVAWVLISPVLITGTIFSGFGVKEKGYQKESIRIFAVVSFFVDILFFFVPVVAALLYASSIGN